MNEWSLPVRECAEDEGGGEKPAVFVTVAASAAFGKGDPKTADAAAAREALDVSKEELGDCPFREASIENDVVSEVFG